jgi:hypothetical protein
VNRDGEPEAHVHARRVRLHRRVDELLELGELDDLVEAPRDLRFERPSMMPLMKTFSRPEISGWNPAPSSISAEIAPLTVDVPVVGLVMPATHLSMVLLPDRSGR